MSRASAAAAPPHPHLVGGKSPLAWRRIRDQFEQLLRPKQRLPGGKDDPRVRLEKLRRLVVLEGLPPESDRERSVHLSQCSLRGRVWKLLLGVRRVDAREYMGILGRCPAGGGMEEKIEKDIERTLKNNRQYHSRVSDDKLRRVLNAYVTSVGQSGGGKGASDTNGATHSGGNVVGGGGGSADVVVADGLYVQGMNVLAAPFLYVMNELDAFFSLRRLLTHHCPRYVTMSLTGAQEATRLLQQVLRHNDPELSAHLVSMYGAEWGPVTSLPHMLSLSASKPIPLPVIVQLWDVLFACGVHLNVIFVAAHMMLARDLLLAKTQGEVQKMLWWCEGLPEVDPQLVITLSMHVLRKLPASLYDRLVSHPFRDEPSSSGVSGGAGDSSNRSNSEQATDNQAPASPDPSAPPIPAAPHASGARDALPAPSSAMLAARPQADSTGAAAAAGRANNKHKPLGSQLLDRARAMREARLGKHRN